MHFFGCIISFSLLKNGLFVAFPTETYFESDRKILDFSVNIFCKSLSATFGVVMTSCVIMLLKFSYPH